MKNTTDQAREIVELTQGNICNRCLGRNFYPQLSGKDNADRGTYLKEILSREEIKQKVASYVEMFFWTWKIPWRK
jgi:tRNA pseudouridine synthase 10